jgi:hypothetical protein
LTFVGVMLLASAGLLHAQTNEPSAPAPNNTDRQVLPDIGAPSGFTGTTAGIQSDASSDARADSGSGHHARSSAASPFRIPRTMSKTTDSGTKFQFSLPRVGFGAGQRIGQISPLDSNGMGSTGSRGNAAFPSDNSNFLQPTDSASNGMFDTSADGMSRGGRGGGGGRGAGGGGAGGPGFDVKSSIFDVNMGMSMKDMMGGSFAQNGGGGSSAGSGFSMGGSNAGDVTGTGGLHAPGSEGRGAGAGPRLSLGLRF